MKIKDNFLASMVFLFLLFTITFLGCSSGGGDSPPSPPPPSPSIQLFPSSYDFGIVTPGNDALPLEVKIANNGSALLTLSDITLSDEANFALNLNGGSSPCGLAPWTIDAGDNCTLVIDFTPTDFLSFNADLTIESDDSAAPTINLPLSGISDSSIAELNVQIAQVVPDCPGAVTAYVSVVDQGGNPVTSLTETNFSVIEDTVNLGAPTEASFVSDVAAPVPISVALVMDYSGSITDIEDTVLDMQDSVKSFVDEMGNNDETEIIKFATLKEVVQPFTSDKVALKAAVDAPWDGGRGTVLYDAVYQAIQDVAARANDRKAVIVITDGSDTQSEKILTDVINLGKDNGVPVFAIGLGDLDAEILGQMANGTGGQYISALSSDNLKTIYLQLARVFYNDQYVLNYTSGAAAGAVQLTIGAELNGVTGNDTTEFTCP